MADNVLTTGVRKILSGVIGLIVGIIFGIILSYTAAKFFIIIYKLRFDHIPTYRIYQSSGIFASILYSIIGSTLFSPIFGRLKQTLIRVLIGLLLGAIAGGHLGYSFLYVPYVEEFGTNEFVTYTAFWGALGGFLVALSINRILNFTIYRSNSIKIDLTPTTSGIWSAIIGGVFALTVTLISLNKDFWSKEDDKLYIVVFSTTDKKEAISYAMNKVNNDYSPEIYFSSNGSYAVTIGYYEPSKAKYVKDNAIENGLISNTAYLIGSKGIIKKVYP